MLKDLLNKLLLRVGTPLSSGSIAYDAPTIPSGEDVGERTITATADGYFQLWLWNITGGHIANQTIKYSSENRYFGSGAEIWSATSRGSFKFWVPCSKGDQIYVSVAVLEGDTPGGNIIFYPKVGAQ